MIDRQPGSPIQLTHAATKPLSRWILLAICLIYGLSGLFGRDPWKNEDAAGFGVMWNMAHGDWFDWLIPNIAARPIVAAGPLAYWPGALSIRLFGHWIGDVNAAHLATGLLFFASCALIWYGSYLLGRRKEAQPFAFVFGGHPNPQDYGRTLADGALLTFLACVGLAMHIHETTAEVTQLWLVSMLLYGLIRSTDKAIQGALWVGTALGGIALAGGPLLMAVMTLAALLSAWSCHATRLRPLLFALLLALLLGGWWPLWMRIAGSDSPDIRFFLLQWLKHDRERFAWPSFSGLVFILRNMPLFAWPVWPLAIWTWIRWRGARRDAHIALPLGIALACLLIGFLQRSPSPLLFMLMMPALSVLAAFGLPTLKRGVINAMDWFALLIFSLLGCFVWLVWLAKMTGIPTQLARNLFRLLPGFQPEFNPLALLAALTVTAIWVLIVRWRLDRAPKVLWRNVVISSAGTTLLWVLLMTLWLPTINYAKTYRDVALNIAQTLSNNYVCIQPVRLSNAQLASFAYLGGLRFGSAEDGCDILLRQDGKQYGYPGSSSHHEWQLLWEGRRPADRDEWFTLYRLHATPLPSASPQTHRLRSNE